MDGELSLSFSKHCRVNDMMRRWKTFDETRTAEKSLVPVFISQKLPQFGLNIIYIMKFTTNLSCFKICHAS